MVENLILGAGPAGMACAMELHNKGKKSLIIEKDSAVGGLAKTLTFKEGNLIFRTDMGPHRFFSKNKYLYELIEHLLGDDWMLIKRKTRQLIEGKFYDYPINAMQAFKNIGFFRAMGMGFSYFLGVVKFRILKHKINNFEDYIASNFGKKLGEFNMFNYTEKIWGLPCKELHADWAKQRIKGLNLVSALRNALFKSQKGPKTLVDQFYYPRFGTGTIYETIASHVKDDGSEIKLETMPTEIAHKDNHITLVKTNDGKEHSPDNLISSIPIDAFVRLLKPTAPKKVLEALTHLKWRAQVHLFITLDKKNITNDNWIYFPNREVPFGRVAEMKNFSKEMSPKDKTSLFVEFFVTEGDKIWEMDKKDLFELAIKHFEGLKLLTRKDVRNYYTVKRKNVYPVYDLHYLKSLEIVKNYLDGFDNLYWIGRPGRFKYNNQDHSLEMGIAAAKSIIEGKKHDFDKIGSEDEYFEKGYIENTSR